MKGLPDRYGVEPTEFKKVIKGQKKDKEKEKKMVDTMAKMAIESNKAWHLLTFSIFEDTLTRSPFSLPAIYSCLKRENNPLTVKERSHIIEKGLADINPKDYGRFKIIG